MAYEWATWLAGVLRDAGVSVVEYPGWTTRGQDDGPFEPRALIFHHDASAAGATPGEPDYLADLSHPGAQCWVDMTGVWHLIAAGRMWHAGAGPGWGVIPADEGNTYSIGVETDHTTGEVWPPAQLDGIRRGMAAICKARGWDPATAIAGHKEYAPGRKDDPDGVDLDDFRSDVAALVAHPTDTRNGDDMVGGLYQVAGEDQVWVGGPGYWRGLRNAEELDVLAGPGGYGPVRKVNARQRDVLRVNFMRMAAPVLDPAAVAAAVVAALPKTATGSGVTKADVESAMRTVLVDGVGTEPTP